MSAREVNELIRQAADKAARETDFEPEPGLTEEINWPIEVKLQRGLAGAISNTTQIGYVNGAKGWLIYRGYNCFDLAEKSSFEETCYLLLYGKLPNSSELNAFDGKLKKYRTVPQSVLDVLKMIPTKSSHPMSALATAISMLGNLDAQSEDTSVENETEISLKLISQMATLAGAIGRIREGKDLLPPNGELTHASNFLYMLTGNVPDEMTERIMDASLILHADHGMNASTFTTMVVNSSLSDMYSSVVGGICSLKGPLHGGANEQVVLSLQEIGSVDNVSTWYQKKRAAKEKVMGFGHRVYKAYDPRARIFGPIAKLMAEKNAENKIIYEIAAKLAETVVAELGMERKIFPNVDFYSGIIYKVMGIDTNMFTPIFAVSRIAGWTARALEYLAENRLFRPRAVYTGPTKIDYKSIAER